ncbi:MAG: TolC family protein [Fluviicola sp.]
MKVIKVLMTIIGIGLINHTNAQPLDSILMRVVENNGELKSLQLEFEAELLRVDQVSQLPDPQLGVGVPILRPETRLGPQTIMVSASQMFPWFGTLKSKEDVVISMSKAKFEQVEAKRLVLFNQVKNAYYKLQFLNEKEEILTDILSQLNILKNVSLANVESGKASSTNVLRIQLKIDDLNNTLDKTEQEKEKEYAVINGITRQRWSNVIRTEGEMELPLMTFDLEVYQKRIQSDFPMIRMLDMQKEASLNRLEVNRKMGAPKFGIGLDYALVNERVDMNPANNGRDILVPKVMVSVPIYRKAYKSKEKEELLIQESLDFSKEQLVAELLSILIQYKTEYDIAVLDKNLAQRQIETSTLVYNMLIKDYSSTGKGFDELLEVQLQMLNYKLQEKQSLLNAKIALSNIERITDY